MSIRTKILMLLLAVSVLPLGVMGFLDHKATKNLMAELTEKAVTRQTEKLTGDLERSVAMTTKVIAQNKSLIEHSISQLAAAVERRILVGSDADPFVIPTLPLAQFQGNGDTPPGMTAGVEYMVNKPGGLAEPLSITFEAPVWSLAPGVDVGETSFDRAVTTDLGQDLKALFLEEKDLVLWMRVGFASGLLVSYPGHGAINTEIDHRQQDWYAWTLDEKIASWFHARPDPVTGESVLTYAVPIHDASNQVVAVAAVDVGLGNPLAQIRGLTELPEGRSFIVDVPFDGRYAGLPVVVAGEDADGKPLGFGPLPGADSDVLARMSERLLAEQSGVVRQSFEGDDALWSWGALDKDGTVVLMIVPFSVIGDQLEQMEDVLWAETQRLVASGGAIFLVMFGLLVFIAFRASKRVTEPARKLAEAAKGLAKGDFSVRAEVNGSDEIAQLAETFNETVPALEERLQYQKSLQLAEEVQQNLLPSSPVLLPGFEVAGQIFYCDETGGDYFDFFTLGPDDGQGPMAVVLGDVSGHGVASALLMTTARAQLRALKDIVREPGQLLTQVNGHLSRDIQAGRFMTMIMLVLAPGQNQISWANAGHIPPLICRAATGARLDLERGGIPLGIEADWAYDTISKDYLAEGDLLVISTDGLWDCANEAGEVFGEARYRDFVKTYNHLDAQAFVAELMKTVEAFRGSAPRVDDITVVAVKRV